MGSISEQIFYYDEMDSMKKDMPRSAVCWVPLFDRNSSKLAVLYQHLVMIIDSFLRTEEVGFRDTHFVISNDPEADVSSWKRIKGGFHIQLNEVIDENDITVQDIAETIYNLANALMHSLIDHESPDRDTRIPWAEEIICGASALAILRFVSDSWEDTSLAEDYSAVDFRAAANEKIGFWTSISGESVLLRCPDHKTLMGLSKRIKECNCNDEINDLYWRIRPEDLPLLANVRHETNGHQMIHTKYWSEEFRESDAIQYICRLQERIPGCILPEGKDEYINLFDKSVSPRQISAYEKKVRALRDLPNEFVIFDLVSADGPIKEKQLSFYQLCRDGDGMHIEVNFHDANGPSQYYKKVSIDESVEMMKFVLARKGFPNVRGWKNITEEVFGDKKPVHIRSRYEDREFCPVCGRRTLTKAKLWERCPVCYWQDDPAQRRNPNSAGSNGSLTLSQAKTIWESGKKIYDTIKAEYMTPQ